MTCSTCNVRIFGSRPAWIIGRVSRGSGQWGDGLVGPALVCQVAGVVLLWMGPSKALASSCDHYLVFGNPPSAMGPYTHPTELVWASSGEPPSRSRFRRAPSPRPEPADPAEIVGRRERTGDGGEGKGE